MEFPLDRDHPGTVYSGQSVKNLPDRIVFEFKDGKKEAKAKFCGVMRHGNNGDFVNCPSILHGRDMEGRHLAALDAYGPIYYCFYHTISLLCVKLQVNQIVSIHAGPVTSNPTSARKHNRRKTGTFCISTTGRKVSASLFLISDIFR